MKNWNWKMKLKTNKTFIKVPGTKTRNKRNKNWNWNTNNKDGQIVILRGKKKKREKKPTSEKPNHHLWNAPQHQEKNVVILETTWYNDIFGLEEASPTLPEGRGSLPSTGKCTTRSLTFFWYLFKYQIASKLTW
jgi:hypothetical protein